MLWKCCIQYASKFGKLSSGHRTGKGQFSFQSQRMAMPKKCSNYCTIALISHASKAQILHYKLQQYMNRELLDVKGGFRKGKGTRDQIYNIHWIIEKAREFQKKHLFPLYWLCQSLWLCRSQQTGKFFKRWEYQTTWLTSWEICMQVKQQLKLDMEQQTGSK